MGGGGGATTAQYVHIPVVSWAIEYSVCYRLSSEGNCYSFHSHHHRRQLGFLCSAIIETFRSDYDYEIRTWEAGTRLLHGAVASASNEILD